MVTEKSGERCDLIHSCHPTLRFFAALQNDIKMFVFVITILSMVVIGQLRLHFSPLTSHLGIPSPLWAIIFL